jgi:hypothetical protein
MKTIIHVVDINAPRQECDAALAIYKSLAAWWTATVKA